MLRRVLCQLPSLQPSTSLVPSSFGSQLPSLLQARPLHQLHLRPGARRHREHLQRWSKRFPVLVSSRLSDALSSAAPPDPAGERSFDIFSRLLRERIVMINGPIDENTSSVVVAQLLFLESENPDQPISMYISSPGGHVVAGLGIYDTMQYIRNPVHTICVGHASSMASLLLCAGEPGHRSSLPNARIMLHQPSGGFEFRLHYLFLEHSGTPWLKIHACKNEAQAVGAALWQGQATDIGIRAKEMALTRKRLAEIYVQHTGQDFDTIERTLERDSFKSAAEAAAFGLIDKVLDRRPAAEEGS